MRNCLRRNFCSKCSKEGARSGTKIKTQKEVVIIKFINLNKSKRKNVVQALAYMNTFSRDIYVLYQNPKKKLVPPQSFFIYLRKKSHVVVSFHFHHRSSSAFYSTLPKRK